MITFEVKGGLFSADLLEDLSSRQGQTPADFNLSSGTRVTDEASRVLSMARNQWANYKQAMERLHAEESGVSETRTLWVIPLLSFLGYELQYQKGSETIGESSFYISHRAINKDQFPVHIGSFRESLDENPNQSRGNRESAHVQMQEYLNHTEHLYGIVTNGYKLRLLRDHHRLTGIQYLEWDLEQLMEENDLASFAMLYRMLHVSRIPKRQGEDSLLEQYHQHSVEEGHRVRDKLKTAVHKCLHLLGNGFLTHPDNEDLRSALTIGAVSDIAYGHYLRTLVYRLLFLFVAEDRKLLFAPESEAAGQKLYREHYSLQRFRNLAEAYVSANPRHSDVWEQLKATFRLFEEEGIGEPLAIAPLGGELFAPDALGTLRSARISNSVFLKALDLLSRFEQEKDQRIRINYRRINVEEFGAVYESLLELNPEINLTGKPASFQYIDGESRKGTGSYYTHQDLVKQLLKTTLEPVVKERLAKAADGINDPELRRQKKREALLSITVCDPACGSGHFLVAAARALATELAYLKAPRGASIDAYEREAMREVIEHCIYGVDLNPDAAELCRLVLWIEAHAPGKPITYLDHKIRCGNSLVGWLGPLEHPVIPDGAFDPVPGDDKAIAKNWKEQNAASKHQTMAIPFEEETEALWRKQGSDFTEVAERPVSTLEDYWRKRAVHKEWSQNAWTANQRTVLNLWAYAFFQPYDESDCPRVVNEVLNAFREGKLTNDSVFLKAVEAEAKAARFFHWPLEFPDVFKNGGFDVLLGNPPWSRIKMQEKKFFSGRKPEIVKAANASERKKLIAALDTDDVHFLAFQQAKRHSNGLSRFLRKCEQYKLTNAGDINTYSVFSERVLGLIAPRGRAGTIVPTGICTDHTNRHFFAHLVEGKRLASLFDFENRVGLFPEVDSRFKSCLLSLVGKKVGAEMKPQFGFYLHHVSDLNDPQRVFELSAEDFVRINPNTKTCPVLRTRSDADLVKSIYARFPVIETDERSPWGVKFKRMFDMSIDAKHFQYRIDFFGVEKQRLRLYEAKMFWHYNHRFNSFKDNADRNKGVHQHGVKELMDPTNLAKSFYHVSDNVVKKRMELLKMGSETRWMLGYRGISCATNVRTFVNTILPEAAFGHTCLLMQIDKASNKQCALVANLSSLIFDYLCRQKVGGNSVGFFIVKQLPIIPPESFSEQDLMFIIPRVLELTYTAWDLKYFADDVWHQARHDQLLKDLIQKRWEHNKSLVSIPKKLEATFSKPEWVDSQQGEFPHAPFRWDSHHRHYIQSELDAFFAFKYGLDTEELKYILDPTLSELAGETQEERDAFPGETFRVLKEKELKKYREYRTARLVLEAWENKPWEWSEDLPDQAVTSQAARARRNYLLIRTMAPVMARIIQRNEHPRYARLLGRTKMEKVLHMIEAETALDFGRLPEKHHYGPADLVALDGAISVGEVQRAFQQKPHNPKNEAEGFFYQKLDGFNAMVEQYESDTAKHQASVDRIIDLFVSLDRTQCELISTVYATWNNLLINGENLENDDRIITESHEWSEAKKSKFRPADFIQPLGWLRENGLVPKGEGKLVIAV